MNDINDTLPGLMRRATENLEPASTDLVERGIRRGAAQRRHRTILQAAAGVTAVVATAAVVVTGTQVFGGQAQKSPAAGPPTAAATTATSTARSPAAKPVTKAETLQTLVRLLPARLKVKSSQTWGEAGFNGASVVVDDGQGAALISVALSAPGMDGTCYNPSPGSCVARPEGSKLTVEENSPTYDKDNNPGGVLRNWVNVIRKGGGGISLLSFNAVQEKQTEHTRKLPVLTVAEQTVIADSDQWRFPPAQPRPTGGPSKPEPKDPGAGKAAVPVQQTLQTLKSVLPKGSQLTKPETWGGGTNGYNGAAYVTNDGHGASRIEVLVRYAEPLKKCTAERGTTFCKVRKDGSVVGWSKDEVEYADARQDKYGVLHNSVTISYPDGRTIDLTSYNGPQQKGVKHTRAKAPYSTDQLIEMAGNAGWKFPGSGK
ncbi:hypothetical protein AB0L70_32960 [Kribbella sp. NPDC051952]|uniref:hypothetical protein n=1 Tax=Kribbella sp. NPDC051952 TaxID=3154851 RepID=UPI003415E2A5